MNTKQTNSTDSLRPITDCSSGVKTPQNKNSDLKEWSSCFGKFLNQSSLSKPAKHLRPLQNNEPSTNDPPLGFQRLCSKEAFENYINGTDTIHSLIYRNNIKLLKRHKTLGDQDQVDTNTIPNERVEQCYNKLRNLIGDKIERRKLVGDEKRACEIKKMQFFKTFYYITQDYRQRILNNDLVRFNGGSHETIIKKRLNLKQSTIIRKNTETIQQSQTIKQMKEEEIKYFQLITRNYIANQSQDYLRIIGSQSLQDKEKLKNLMNKHINLKVIKTGSPRNDTQVQKDYVTKLQQFQAYNKDLSSTKKIISINDEDFRLFNYLSRMFYQQIKQIQKDKQLKKTIDDFTTAFEQNYVTPYQTNKKVIQKKRSNQKIHHNNFQSQSKESNSDSDHSSLHSEYELRIDTLYGQSKALQQKVLVQQDGFGKRVRQLLKLNHINSQIIGYNRDKLQN